MLKTNFGDEKQSQRDRCLEIAAQLKRKKPLQTITPSLVTHACLKAKNFFTKEQLKSFQFQMARKTVEQWLKTPDEKGLPLWGQLPLVTSDGERAWEVRQEMELGGYAWNFIIRDDMVVKNTILRDRWRDEALERWSAAEFEVEVERLQKEREQASGAA